MKSIDAENLGLFFNRLQTAWHKDNQVDSHETGLDTTRLKAFFDALRTCDFGQAETADKTEKPVPRVEIDAQGLQRYFDLLRKGIEKTRASGGFCSPWRIAGLNRNEVRNTAVLAWLLDPHGDHGLGDLLLNALLKLIHRSYAYIPESCMGRVSVLTEVSPEDDRCNRVDIEIDSTQFYILIEVKINASEGNEHIDRYEKSAQKMAGSRPWIILFLTTDGKIARTAGDHARVMPLSWRKLSDSLRRALLQRERKAHEYDFNDRIAELYLHFVRNF